MPLIAREFVSLVGAGSSVNETVSLSNYAFLYGTFPTAPGVFVYATHYDLAVQMVRLNGEKLEAKIAGVRFIYGRFLIADRRWYGGLHVHFGSAHVCFRENDNDHSVGS